MHVVFAVPPIAGAVMTSLGLAEELVRRGHRVTYLAPVEFQQRIASVGAELLASSSGNLTSGNSENQTLADIVAAAVSSAITEVARIFRECSRH